MMVHGSTREYCKVVYDHTGGGRVEEIRQQLLHSLESLAQCNILSYQESRKAVGNWFQKTPLRLSHPITQDDDARKIIQEVMEIEAELVQRHPECEETYHRLGRHIREYLAGHLLHLHLDYIAHTINCGESGAREFIEHLGVSYNLDTPKSVQRFLKKIALYHEVGSFVHPAEINLSTEKVRTRAGARAEKGNLWPIDRREKYEYLEGLADALKTCPPFTESDLDFLVSQSSLEMLQKKSNLLLEHIGYIEPNRLKSNYTRLDEHLQRNQQRKSDYDQRRELLLKLGATEQQIAYISARATYQTMKNLLRLANGKLAISDLMGGKRTIKKLLRRRGKAQSTAEEQIARHLIRSEGIDARVANAYARTRKNHSLEHLIQTVEFLKENYRRIYKAHWGFNIQPGVLRRALELGLSRQKLSKRTLASKDFLSDLRRSLAIEEAQIIKERNNDLTPDARRAALAPLKEALDYETDTDTKKQLYFIYEQFCQHGLCIPKDQLKEYCLRNPRLFPSSRKVQDAIEILNGAYRCIGQHGESLCVLPDYVNIQKVTNRQSIM